MDCSSNYRPSANTGSSIASIRRWQPRTATAPSRRVESDRINRIHTIGETDPTPNFHSVNSVNSVYQPVSAVFPALLRRNPEESDGHVGGLEYVRISWRLNG